MLARQLGQARLAAERARDHVAQLLAFSRPQRGERRLLAPAPLAQQALQLLRPDLPSSIAVDSATPRTDGRCRRCVADPVQLEQVLFNLCINARDAIHGHGTIRVGIGYSARRRPHCASCSAPLDSGRWVWVEVADNGSGMPRDVMERMFEPFFTTKEVGRGTGMGLAMVHGIVHDHGGHVRVDSAPGEGSVFRVLLPAAAQERQPAAVHRPAAPAARRAASRPGAAGGRRGHGQRLHGEPADRLGAGGGAGARPARRSPAPGRARRIDLLLTDQTMPGMTGLALSRHAVRSPARPAGPGVHGQRHRKSASGAGALRRARLLRKPIDGANCASCSAHAN